MISLLIKTVIKLAMIAVFIGCLQRQPYGYYEFTRYAAFILFALTAVIDFKLKHYILIIPSICIAVLFNPFAKYIFRRATWQNIDKAMIIVIAAWVIVESVIYIFIRMRKSKVNQ